MDKDDYKPIMKEKNKPLLMGGEKKARKEAAARRLSHNATKKTGQQFYPQTQTYACAGQSKFLILEQNV